MQNTIPIHKKAWKRVDRVNGKYQYMCMHGISAWLEFVLTQNITINYTSAYNIIRGRVILHRTLPSA